MAVTNSAREVTTLASMPRCAKYPRTAWALNSSQAGLGARLSSAEGLQLSSISRRGKLPARACTLTGAAAAGAALTVEVSLASTVPTGEAPPAGGGGWGGAGGGGGGAAGGEALTVKVSLASTVPAGEPLAAVAADQVTV